jgi:hyperosmotically inducible periplasmic protein
MNTLSTLKSTTLAIALAFGVSAMPAAAFDTDAIQDGQAPLAAEFKKLDVNANEQLTQTEASGDKLFTANHFAKADIDANGTLSQQEYATYKSSAQQKVVKRVASDSVITSKAKAELLAEKDLKSLQISVKTYKGDVILSGFVDNEISKQKAETIVSKIEGVKSVKNSLVVKS